jgi:hypothetical protein
MKAAATPHLRDARRHALAISVPASQLQNAAELSKLNVGQLSERRFRTRIQGHAIQKIFQSLLPG